MASNLRMQMLEILAQLRAGAETCEVLANASNIHDFNGDGGKSKKILLQRVARIQQATDELEAKIKRSD